MTSKLCMILYELIINHHQNYASSNWVFPLFVTK